MKDHLSMSEREKIEKIQDALGEIKACLRAVEMENKASGRLAAANAAMGFRGEIITLHSRMTVALHEMFPEFASDIQLRGGGGR